MKFIQEHIHEKFVEDSDPIKDLGISLSSMIKPRTILLCKKSIQPTINPKYTQKFIIQPGMYSIIKNSNIINLDTVQLELATYKRYPYFFKEVDFQFIGGEFLTISAKEFFEHFEIVKNSVNEKFTEEPTNPISDMGIGGYTFKTLKPGAVLQVRDDINSAIALTKNNSGHFTDWSSGMKLSEDNYILVTNVINFGDYKDIHIKKFWDEDELLKVREYFKETGKLLWAGKNNRMIVSEKMFNNRFKVIERGF